MKRSFDILISGIALLLLLPVGLVVAIAVWWSMGRPVLFRQVRPGLGGKPFEVMKFRTMSSETDDDGQLLPDHQRMTRVGRFLRSSSLDELPQLWNVIRGDMSLVGPRPLLTEYLDRYTPRQARRHEVRPGITGLAQVNGRNAASWSDRLEMDVRYVEQQSLWLDLKIIWRTFFKVSKREGITQAGHATVERFQGDSQTAGGSA